MKVPEYLLKEYELAHDRYKFHSEAKTKFIGIYLTILTVIFPFMINGSLPESTYFVFAAFMLIMIFFHTYLTHKQVTSWRLWHYLEKKVNHSMREQGYQEMLLDLGEKTIYIGYGYGGHTLANKLTTYLLVIVFISIYEYCILQGCLWLRLGINDIVATHAIYYGLVIAFTLSSLYQNKQRKKRFNKIIKELNY